MKHKYKHRDERVIRDEVKASRFYESRRSLRSKQDVTQFVNKIRRDVNKGRTFQGLGDHDVEDRYYTESAFPPLDVITVMRGMGQVEAKDTKTSWAAIGLIILVLAFLNKKA